MTITEPAVSSVVPARRTRLTMWLVAALVLALAAVAALAVALARNGSGSTSTPNMGSVMKVALDTGNPAGLAPFFAPSVDYAIAASGSFGVTSGAKAAQIVADYVSNANGPWNVSATGSTVDAYRHGPYSRYLHDDTFFGVSKDARFVSIRVNSAGRIDQVFLAANTQFVE